MKRASQPRDLRVARFRGIYEETHSAVHAYCRRRTPSKADADDVVAEVFLVAWRRLDDLSEDEPTLPWLYGVAWRVLSNQRRGLQRRDALASRLERDPTSSQATAVSDPGEEVREALGRLSVGEQEILRLHCWEDLSHQEIATALGVSVNAATIRLHRARKALAGELARKKAAPSGQNLLDDTTETP